MDDEDLRSLLRDSSVDLWTLIDAAISLAAREHGDELRARRDGIVERLYARTLSKRDCDHEDRAPSQVGLGDRARSNGREEAKGSSSPAGKGGGSRSPPTPQSMNREERVDDEEGEEEDQERTNGVPVDDCKSKILAIKEFLDDEDQPEDQVVSLLQNLVDLDVTFKALKETDIGRFVNGLRKHPSGEVRRLVKLIVRKWKEIVDDWVKSSSTNENGVLSDARMGLGADGDSPLQNHGRGNENGHLVPDFGCSPNPHNGSADQVEYKAKATIQRREPAPPPKQTQATPTSASRSIKEQRDNSLMDPERLASARRRLQENYQEAQNAKKQRTIQVMNIDEIPKAKNTFVARNKGGGSNHHGNKHW